MQEVQEALADVGYKNLNECDFKLAVAEGPKSVLFTQLVEWISKELQSLYALDEHVNSISSHDDSSLFLMELSSFLKELGCSYSTLTEGHINQRLQSESNRILLLDYLLTELKSARMYQFNKPDETFHLKLNESCTATDLKNILMTLKFPKPPANIPPKTLFNKVEEKVKVIRSKLPVSLSNEPLFFGKLSDKQWHSLDLYFRELLIEYRMRREMLLKRLDVTIQSFEWSDRLKEKSIDIKSSFLSVRKSLIVEPNVKLSDVLAARKDLAILEKTSSASVRRKTQSDVNKVMIGHVPDRGGRPYEQEPPPPEMPSWQQRNNGGPSASRGRGARSCNFQFGGNSGKPVADSSRGGRVQAGWNGPQLNFQSQNENSGYDQHRRNHYSRQENYQQFSNQRNVDGNRRYQSSGNSGYDNCQNNSYDNRQLQSGFINSRGRGGAVQRFCDKKEYHDYRNKNDGSRNYNNR